MVNNGLTVNGAGCPPRTDREGTDHAMVALSKARDKAAFRNLDKDLVWGLRPFSSNPQVPLQPLGLLLGYQMLSSKKTRSYSLDPLLWGDSLLGPFSGSLEVIGLPAPPWALGRRQGKEPDLPYLCCLALSSPLKLISHVKIAPAPPAMTTGPR